MKKIEIFLASSVDELKDERKLFGAFINDLNTIYENKGCRIILKHCDNLPSGYAGCPMQEEYNAIVRECDLFVGLFYTKAGQYTIEEYDTAKAAQKSNGKPKKLYIFCRELAKDKEEDSLKKFKEERLSNEHHWKTYKNREDLHLQFLIQLIIFNNDKWKELRVECGRVLFGSLEIAQMRNLGFAANNRYYQKKSRELDKKVSEIEIARLNVEKNPEDQGSQKNLQELINEKVKIHKDIERQQKDLLNTAMNIAKLQNDRITNLTQRAIDAFNAGNLQYAKIILKEAEQYLQRAIDDFEQIENLKERKRQNVIEYIKAVEVKINLFNIDTEDSIDEEISYIISLYEKLESAAEKIDYDKDEYLYNHAQFLYDHALYQEANKIVEKLIPLTSDKAKTYNLQGKIFYCLDMYDEAIVIYCKALDILIENNDPDDILFADICNNIGRVYNRIGESDKAIEQGYNALKKSGKEGQRSKSFETIAEGLWTQGNVKKALEYYEKALKIEKIKFGEESKEVAITYRHIGDAYRGMNDDDSALKNYLSALSILKQKIGDNHPETALTYGCIGVAYMNKGMYDEALENTNKGLKIREYMLGCDNTQTAESYYWLGEIYSKQSKYDKALEYYNKAREVRIKRYGISHSETLNVEYAIAMLYIDKGENPKAIEYFQKFIDNLRETYNKETRAHVTAYYYWGIIYGSVGEYEQAIKWLKKALEKSKGYAINDEYFVGNIHMYTTFIYERMDELLKSVDHCFKALELLQKVNGDEGFEVAFMYNLIGNIYTKAGSHEQALVYHQKALDIQKCAIDTNDFCVADIYENIAQDYLFLEDYSQARCQYYNALKRRDVDDKKNAYSYNNIGSTYYSQCDYQKSLEYFKKALVMLEKDHGTDYSIFICNIASAYLAQGDYQNAKEYYLKAASLQERTLGVDNPETISSYYFIGLIYEQMEKYPEALVYYEKVLKYHTQDPQTPHLVIAEDNYRIGTQYFNLKKYGEATKYYYESARIRKEYCENKDSDMELALSYYYLATAYYQQLHLLTALDYFNNALNIFEKVSASTDEDKQNRQAWIDELNSIIDELNSILNEGN